MTRMTHASENIILRSVIISQIVIHNNRVIKAQISEDRSQEEDEECACFAPCKRVRYDHEISFAKLSEKILKDL